MDVFQSILQRVGIRQLPGICWYPAKCTGNPVNARWHRGLCRTFYLCTRFVLDRFIFFCQGRFFIPINSSDKIATKSSVMISGSEV